MVKLAMESVSEEWAVWGGTHVMGIKTPGGRGSEKVSWNLKQEGQAVWAGAGDERVQPSPPPPQGLAVPQNSESVSG